VILAAIPALATAEEQYQPVTVDELKRIQKQNEEEQRRLEATPEFQARKAEERRQRELDAFLAKERELKLQKDAADLRRKELENLALASQISSSQMSSGGTNTVLVTSPFVPFFNVPRLAVVPFPIRVRPFVRPPFVPFTPMIRPAVRFRR
jgi:hypothetical protein